MERDHRYRVVPPASPVRRIVELPLSKSISNRVLMIESLAGITQLVPQYAECDDTAAMQAALSIISDASRDEVTTIDVGAAGTAMRFLTAKLAITEGEWLLTGSERMRQRPIAPLVDALRTLGATIEYVGEEGCPPLRISGSLLPGGEVSIRGDISSQYTSALFMIAPMLSQGLAIELLGEVVSMPYIQMTASLMMQLGASMEQDEAVIRIAPTGYHRIDGLTIEADWTAASYWYELAALMPKCRIELPGLRRDSLQGDAALVDLYDPLGVATSFNDEGAVLTSTRCDLSAYDQDFCEQPDLVQAVAVTCAMKGLPFCLEGVQSLKVKESDRIEALRCELLKLGCELESSDGTILEWQGKRIAPAANPVISTYDDHRMAMAFAPAAVVVGELSIDDPLVVTKSYPTYWRALEQAGFNLDKE